MLVLKYLCVLICCTLASGFLLYFLYPMFVDPYQNRLFWSAAFGIALLNLFITYNIHLLLGRIYQIRLINWAVICFLIPIAFTLLIQSLTFGVRFSHILLVTLSISVVACAIPKFHRSLFRN